VRRIETEIPEVCLIEPTVFGDARGFFLERYHQARYADMGITDVFVQDNHAKSFKGIVRGLHYQIERAQAKFCWVVAGEVLDVAVDIRLGSPTFGKHVSTILSADNKIQIYVPAGFAHGYAVLSETAEFLYKCSDFYFPEHERGVLWNDAELGIDWQVETPLLSEKDQRHLPLSKILPSDLPQYRS
jgi:dTDP-4-dehydrorhamnose 3,5-epimerase